MTTPAQPPASRPLPPMTMRLTLHEKQVLSLLAECAVNPSARLAPSKVADLISGLSPDVQHVANAIDRGAAHPLAKAFLDWAREGLPVTSPKT